MSQIADWPRLEMQVNWDLALEEHAIVLVWKYEKHHCYCGRRNLSKGAH